MKKIIFVIYAICAAFIITGVFTHTGSIAGTKKTWVPEHKLRSRTVIPGHWRPAGKPGFLWVNGQTVAGVWIAGYWKPEGAAPAGNIWVKGYWQNGKWLAGRWVPKKEGIWVPGHHDRSGRWIPGHYK